MQAWQAKLGRLLEQMREPADEEVATAMDSAALQAAASEEALVGEPDISDAFHDVGDLSDFADFFGDDD